MTTMSGKQFSVGARLVSIYQLNAAGYPTSGSTAATSGSMASYDGLEITAPKAFEVTTPEPRQIIHVGWDRVGGIDYLPPITASSIRIRVSGDNLPVDALMTGANVITVGEAQFLAGLGSNQGNEPVVGLLFYQQASDIYTGFRRWRTYLLPVCKCIPLPSGGTDQSNENQYAVSPLIGTAHLWGTPMTLVADGTTQEQYLRGMCEGKPHVASWIGDGATMNFMFAAAFQALNTSKIAVFNNGTPVTVGLTKAVDHITIATPPTVGAVITAFYEVL